MEKNTWGYIIFFSGYALACSAGVLYLVMIYAPQNGLSVYFPIVARLWLLSGVTGILLMILASFCYPAAQQLLDCA